MIQSSNDLDKWHSEPDPWGYETNKEDAKRKELILSEIPNKNYQNVLDIGCGQGFITKNLPGKKVIGVDISKSAIDLAKKTERENLLFQQGSIFDLNSLLSTKYDLVIITGVLYPQYVGQSSNLIYIIIDELLQTGGYLISVHIDNWYTFQFPFLKTKQLYYEYREYVHKLEVYVK